jgi:putative ABC transport system ATP-binding protein
MIATLDPPEAALVPDLHQQVAVSCEGLTKEFIAGDTRTIALHDVDLEVYAGQLTFVVGPSGCGKTTLISIIAGLLEPTRGSVAVLGTDFAKISARGLVDFRARSIGFVFQQYNLLPALTAAENVAVPLIITGTRRPAAISRARQMLGRVGLADRADSFPAQLSGGQQQRVAIARALINDPKLLVCDEPTAALDAKAGQMVLELIKEIAVEAGRAVIVVTHDSRIYGFEDRMVEMSDGRIEHIDGGEHWTADARKLAHTGMNSTTIRRR